LLKRSGGNQEDTPRRRTSAQRRQEGASTSVTNCTGDNGGGGVKDGDLAFGRESHEPLKKPGHATDGGSKGRDEYK